MTAEEAPRGSDLLFLLLFLGAAEGALAGCPSAGDTRLTALSESPPGRAEGQLTDLAAGAVLQGCLLTGPIWCLLPAGHHQLLLAGQPGVTAFPLGSRKFSVILGPRCPGAWEQGGAAF